MKSYGYKNIYGHHCTAAVVEKDVIDLEIPGNNVRSRLKRWWNDLFLLSYTDKRAARFYLSPYAMMMARAAHYQDYRSQIHPLSKFKNAWDCLMLHLLLIHMFMFHLNTSVTLELHPFCHYLLAAIEYMFFMDIYINTKTGYTIEETRQVVMNSSDVILNYVTTKSFIQVMTAIPVENIMILRLGETVSESTTKSNLLVCTLKLISLNHIIRLFQLSQFWSKERETFRRTVTFKFIRITIVGLMAMVLILTFISAINVELVIRNPDQADGSFVHTLLMRKHYANDPELRNKATFIIRLFARLCKCLFLFGHSANPYNHHPLDQITAILTYSIAFLFHFWAAVLLYNCISRHCSLDDYLLVTKMQTDTLLRVRGLPDVTYDKVAKYFDYRMSSLRVIETKNCLFKALPLVLKRQIKISSYRSLLEKIPYFSNWPEKVMSKVAELLKSEIYLDGDVVASAKSQLEGLVIVQAGTLAVYSIIEERHLEDGDYFGVEALVIDTDSTLTVVAVASSLVLILDKHDFRNMIKSHNPIFLDHLKRGKVPPKDAW